MTFARLHEQLLETVRQRVRNGDLTERSLARLTGVSQPHIHNVLKGVRALNNSLADAILLQLKMNVWDLTGNSQSEIAAVRNIPLLAGLLGQEGGSFEPERTMGQVAIPALVSAALWRPVMARLGRDDEARPRFEAGDLVLIDQAARPRPELWDDSAYVVETRGGPRLRYLRVAGGRVFLASETSRNEPRRWELVEGGEELDGNAVRGRVIWVSRGFALADGL
jgi:transcriptional regulator with XRE-family HTH domain